MKTNKNELGQFFTKKDFWQQPQILKFINLYNKEMIIDPFAGDGSLLKHFNNFKAKGYDIDEKWGWELNDSLLNIPNINKGFIITNPPYLSKSSAKRKRIENKHLKNSKHNDLYKIALDKMIESKIPGIAIVPESFINSSYDKKHIFSITILIPNPFEDTETPVCIVCFDPNNVFSETKIFKNDKYICTLQELHLKKARILKNNNNLIIKFNEEIGKLALIAYDSAQGNKIKFLKAKNLNYNKPQKISSRVVTKIEINKYVSNDLVNKLNNRLFELREEISDVLLTPFKGNSTQGERRRRLDYKTARLIINSIPLN